MVYLCMVNDIVLSRGDETPASSESRLFAIERKACSERRRGGGFILNVSMGGP